jgi:GAF domain-containing protein
MNSLESPASLEAIIATEELRHRSSPPAGRAAETRAFLSLTQALAQSPHDFFQQLVNWALKLSVAGSTGISLLNVRKGRFVWPAVAGKLKSYLGSGTPSDFGPCGTVIDRDSSILFIHPERHFTYLAPITPPLEEVLLIPFHMDEKAVGTIWAVSHEKECKFTEEDRRLLESLSAYAASAYRVLANAGALEPLLDIHPA